MPRTNGRMSDPAVLTASERRRDVVKMRVQGVEPNEIARQLGITRKQVMADLRKVARDNNAEAGVWNHVLVERNEELWRQLQKGIKKGDLWSIDRAFQCLDRAIQLTNADKVASDSGAEIDKWLVGSVEDGGFEDDEDEILGDVVEEFDDLSPDDLEELV